MENTLLNLVPASYLPEVHLSQYDVGRELKFTLKDGSSDYSVPSGAVVTVKATKPSGLGFVVNAVADGNVVTLSNTETMTNENGRFPAELSITQGSTVIGTSNFIFNIERSPHPEGTIDGDAESLLPELTLLVERIEAAADSVDEDTQTVTEAKDEVLQAKADTLQAKADTLSARDDAVSAKDLAVSSAETSVEASERAEELVGSVSTKADAIVKTASGEIASFTDGGDDLPMKSLKVNIVPKQSGSGDPSPSNMRPISGTDTVGVTRAGKNLLNPNLHSGLISGNGSAGNDESVITANRYGYSDKIPSENALIVSAKSTDIQKFNWINVLQYVNGIVVYNCGALNLEDGTRKYLGVPARANSYIRVRFGADSIYAVGDTPSGEVQVEEGTSMMTDYEPYEGESKSISLGQTVYGGTLDVVSGKLTIDRILYQFIASQRLTTNISGKYRFRSTTQPPYKTGVTRGDILVDKYPMVMSTLGGDEGISVNSSTQFFFYSEETATMTLQEFESWLESNPINICYPIETPTEIQLTPTEVNTLLGQNNIWADSGSVEVEYRADTTLAYNELVAMILENIGN